ncbi:MAG: hypothetical protein ACLPZY_01570 [Terracidiphilus sp.]
MNTSVFVEAIAGAVALIVAALSYLFTKVKEREADWRKWKYEQYKEFVATLGAMVGPKPTPESHRTFLKACNTLNLIGSGGVLTSLQAFIASMNADSPREENNARISRLIWEIRKDARIPGTPDAEEFSARLWFPIQGATKRNEGESES